MYIRIYIYTHAHVYIYICINIHTLYISPLRIPTLVQTPQSISESECIPTSKYMEMHMGWLRLVGSLKL